MKYKISFEIDKLNEICEFACEDIYKENEIYNPKRLLKSLDNVIREGISDKDLLKSIIQCALELTNALEPKWEFAATKLYMHSLYNKVSSNRGIENKDMGYNNLYDLINSLTDMNLYGKYILENYNKDEIDELEKYIVPSRDYLFTYSGINLLYKRYLIQNGDKKVLELPQEMFMGISMHLAMKEKDKLYWAKRFYDVLSTLKATMATPTMSNARKPYHQLSSCFIDTVSDSLQGIYKSLDNFAKVSKFGGGMGIYMGKVRALGSDIRNYKGASGGVIPWIKLFNDTAIAVDQLGMRTGSVSIWLDAWHRDLPEFLQLKTNNGDDRKKAHDVFPGIAYPDLFWKLAENDINATWYMMCPHEIKKAKGYELCDFYGEEWEKTYYECIEDPNIEKREIIVKDLVKLIIKSASETGTPFTFNRDISNKLNPNKHKGMIYSSNLCTEIMQNMSALEFIQEEIQDENGDTIIIEKNKSGDFVVCNLSSIVLGRIDVTDLKELEHIVETQIRAMDNVIDLNYYSVPYAKVTNASYRSIGLGTSGYHHMLVNNNIDFESDEHIAFVDTLYENINYFAIKASMNIAKEKGGYKHFKGSDFQTGEYFDLRNYNSDRWNDLRSLVSKNSIRNAYLLAVAPNGSTAAIAGTTEGIDPIMNRFYFEEKKGIITPKVAPDINEENFHLYKSAYEIHQHWSIKANATRQKHIDQSQSFNLYITTSYTMRQILNLYIDAFKQGIKSIYYVRSKSLVVESCESCSV
ncbi:ribonucleotide-diphosphate reductase subunit alpha [Clostridium putrefaciens]|uniref:Ribonucleoside-diphosphate reductase n=1 Tax=Clostridium putrefaciens TaxID=99675 RepID=A0A381J6H4_9CLOT|nr:ribonucleoside-diphosphate reductase subunit alpha [Clostridium putrefaciens]SUY45476.1 ribonucleotide-diphosphate reductase subunit alpha [Clostridium putrefaciens]